MAGNIQTASRFQPTEVSRACAKGEAYLAQNVSAQGWNDFRTPIGKSTHWVTGYVADSMHGHPLARDINRKIGIFLSSEQQWNGGWAYNRLAPADADSTAAVISALINTGSIPAWRMRRAIKFLLSHADPNNGGFKTFRRSVRLRLLMHAFRTSFIGWKQSHTCVTAAVILALLKSDLPRNSSYITSSCNFLANRQNQDGLWQGYWWKTPFYATAQVLRALTTANYPIPQKNLLATSLLDRQLPDGSWQTDSRDCGCAFSTALAISSLILSTETEEAMINTAAIGWLIDQQNADGSWSAGPILQIPEPYDINPSDRKNWIKDGLGSSSIVRGQNNFFTTATVVKTLKEVQLIHF